MCWVEMVFIYREDRKENSIAKRRNSAEFKARVCPVERYAEGKRI